MASQKLVEIMKQAAELPPDEQLELIAHLAVRARDAYQKDGGGYAWSDLAGAAPYPLMGEDAQAWVTRTRREGDEARERQWKRRQ